MTASTEATNKSSHVRSLFQNQSLSLKIIFYIGILLLVAIVISFYLTNETHDKELINLLKLQAHRLTETLKVTIRENMLKHGNHGEIQSLIEAIGERDDIVKVSIICDGTVKASSWREEVGIQGRKDDHGCDYCHYGAKSHPLNVFIHRVFKDPDGKRFIELFNPVQNESVCHQCHPRERQILGVLNVVSSLARLDKSISTRRKVMVISTIIIFLLFIVEMFYFIYRFVHVPIQKLTLATKRVADGDVDYHIDVHSSDEIGILARSFNIMTEKLKKSWSEIEAWNRELEHRVEEATAQLKQANKELEETNSRLRIADQKKTEVLVTVAHDIRGPLSAIKSCVGVVLGGYLQRDPHKQQDMLQRADQRVEELLRFTNDLLDLSLIEESMYAQDEVDWARLMESIQPGLQAYAENRTIGLRISVGKAVPPIKGDAPLLAKCLLYVTENAIKYSHPEGNVSVVIDCNNGNVTCTVVDEGIGIPENELQCIFEPTFRGERARRHSQPGTGVSMALVERIVLTHRGRISVRSEIDRGTTVTITFPLSQGIG